MPDEHVVAWMWNHKDGVVHLLMKCMEDEVCVSPLLKTSLKDINYKYMILKDFGSPWQEGATEPSLPLSPMEGRQKLNKALVGPVQ